MSQLLNQPKRSSTFGIIAIVISIIAFETPRFMMSMVLIALAAFIIIGFARDSNKIPSTIALGISLFLFYIMYQSEMQREAEQSLEQEREDAYYTVKYQATCSDCDASYTNETGGTDHKKNIESEWSTEQQIRGDEFISLSVQGNGEYSGTVYASIYINGRLYKIEKSSGEYAIASVSCRPKDIHGE